MFRGTAFFRIVLWIATGCLSVGPAAVCEAQRSYTILFDQSQGLNAGEIAALAQDQTGYIWIGANGGLIRYDGAHFVWWGGKTVRALVRDIETGATGETIASTEPGRAYEVTGDGLTALKGPRGAAVTEMESSSFDDGGTLWAILSGHLWRRSPDGRWMSVPSAAFGDEHPVRLCRVRRGIGLLTDKSAWILYRSGRTGARLMTGKNLFAIAEVSRGHYWIADHGGVGLWRKDVDKLLPVGRPQGRLMSMIARGDSVWVSIDRYLVTIDAAGRQRVQGLKEGVPSGGPLMADRDGSLWLGTFVGLQKFPQPDTLQWTEEDGLPSNHIHGLAQVGDHLWANTWQGAASLDANGMSTVPHRETDADGDICTDGLDDLWLASAGKLLRWRNGRYVTMLGDFPAQSFQLAGCTSGADGNVWIATSLGLFDAPGGGTPLRLYLGGIHGRVGIGAVWQGHDGSLWLADTEEACKTRIRTDPRADHPLRPRDCVSLPPNTAVSSGVEIRPDMEWLPLSSGLVEIRAGRAMRLSGNSALPGAAIQRLVSSPSGGYWVVGPGALLRVAPCGVCADGWSLLEAPGVGQGLPGNSAVDVLENHAGDLWVAGNRGLFRIPAAARAQPRRPKSLVLVGSSIDGRAVSTARPIVVEPDQHRLELTYSALYFRDPSRLLYRYRLSPKAPWSEPTTDAELQLIDQAPGNYHVQMQASLDGKSWTVPSSVDFSVATPLWRSWPALVLYAMAAIVLLRLAYGLRVRHLLILQRQRMSIAMDLHDELGSSLGSIVALSGVLTNPGIGQSERSRLGGQLASAAQLAGAGLRSIVWTMRDQSVDVATFAAELAEHARRLVPQTPPSLEFAVLCPEDNTHFDARIRRQVLMIVLEAMHNVVRHANAETIKLTFGREASGWQLTIDDDGAGFDTGAMRVGAGLENMHARARQIGGRLSVVSTSGLGTRVTLIFPTGSRGERNIPGKNRSRSLLRENDSD